jgi:microcompartment protein CcmL/EutN
MTTSQPSGPALGLIELCSVARGLVVLDAMVKRAPIHIQRAQPVHPGKFIVLAQGGVDEINEAMDAGQAVAAESLIDTLRLPFPHAQIQHLLSGAVDSTEIIALGVLETFSVAATIRAADAALKASQVEGVVLRLADGLGGKGYFVFSGHQHDVEEGLAHGAAAVGKGLIAGRELLSNPHGEMVAALLAGLSGG